MSPLTIADMLREIARGVKPTVQHRKAAAGGAALIDGAGGTQALIDLGNDRRRERRRELSADRVENLIQRRTDDLAGDICDQHGHPINPNSDCCPCGEREQTRCESCGGIVDSRSIGIVHGAEWCENCRDGYDEEQERGREEDRG